MPKPFMKFYNREKPPKKKQIPKPRVAGKKKTTKKQNSGRSKYINQRRQHILDWEYN